MGLKINQLIQIRVCLPILYNFHFEKHTYADLLRLQKDGEIFKQIM